METTFKPEDLKSMPACQLVQHALNQVVSCMSSLNMQPNPVQNPKGPFLSHQDTNAQHAMDHLYYLLDVLSAVHHKVEGANAALLLRRDQDQASTLLNG